MIRLVEFRDHKNEFEYPIIESLDIETFCDKRGDERVYAENSRIAAIGAHSMGIEGFEPDEEFRCSLFVNHNNGVKCYRHGSTVRFVEETDAFREYLRSRLRLLIQWQAVRDNVASIDLTDEAKAAFEAATSCQHCDEPFTDLGKKCRDHCHLTGRFRRALCDQCNKKAKQPLALLAFTWNGSGYDHCFYLRAIAQLMAGPDRNKNI